MGDSDSLYSRLGRAGTKRFGLIKRTELLLSGKPVKTDRIPLERPVKRTTREELAMIKTGKRAEERKKEEEGKGFGREREESRRETGETPAPGWYDVSYEQVDKHTYFPLISPAKSPVLSLPCSPHLTFPAPKPSKKGLSFTQQLKRDMKWLQVQAHEGRFLSKNLMPEGVSKYRKPGNVRFDRLAPRKEQLFPLQVEAPDYYAPQHTLVQPRSPAHSFPQSTRPLPSSFSPLSYSPHYQSITPKVHQVLNWSLENASSTSPLPSYMTVTSSRLALEAVNEKTLKLNRSLDYLTVS